MATLWLKHVGGVLCWWDNCIHLCAFVGYVTMSYCSMLCHGLFKAN